MSEKRDYVAEAVETFVKGHDADPTDPVKAVETYFEKNAREDLKARAKAEGKTAKSCWTFVEACARKALNGRSGHIDPVCVYAIVMHYFEDVPADWNAKPKTEEKPKSKSKAKEETKAKEEKPTAALPIDIGEAEPEERASAAKPKPSAAKPKKHFKKQQGFFFEMLETEPVGPSGSAANDEGKEASDDAQ